MRPPRKRHGNAYEEDYQPTATLTRLAQEHNIAILVIHHANKLNPVDFRDSASGAMSLLGGADNFWSLHRQPMSEEATLKVTGRDIVNEQELAMQFKDGYWTVLGESNMVRMSAERRSIVDVLWSSDTPMTPKQLATATGKNASTLRTLLSKLVTQGILLQPSEGRYTLTPTYRLSQERERDVDTIDTIDTVDSVDSVDSPGDSDSVSMAVYGSGEECRQPQPIENIDSYGIPVYVSTLSTVSTPLPHNDVPTEAVCPQCHRSACQPYGHNGRVCMQCGYCERPTGPRTEVQP